MISIKDLEENLPEHLTEHICKLSHTLSLKAVHREIRLRRYFHIFKQAYNTNQVYQIKVDTCLTSHHKLFYVYMLPNRIILVAHHRDLLISPSKHHITMAIFLGRPTYTYNLCYVYSTEPEKPEKINQTITEALYYTLGPRNKRSTKFSITEPRETPSVLSKQQIAYITKLKTQPTDCP